MKLVKSLLAVGLSVAASAAIAQPAAGPTPDADTGNSGIIVSVWDAIRGVSLVQYLGLRMDDLLPTAASGAPEAGLTLDFSTLGGASGSGTSWSDVFGSSNAGDIQYMVQSFDYTPNSIADTYIGKRLETTLVSGTAPTNVQMGNAISNGRSFIAAGLNGTGTGACAGSNPCVAVSNVEPDYAGQGSMGSRLGSNLPVSASASVGTALGFYLVSANSNSGLTTKAVVTQYKNSQNLAQWLLTSGGNLSYTLAAAGNVVPLPAAIWLLLSGLAGVGVVGRRRVA
jgi:hypothetical protein